MRKYYLALFAAVALVGWMDATSRADCGCGAGPSCGSEGGGCGDPSCVEPYCCDHVCNSGWICGGGCSSCGSRPCCGLFPLFPCRNECEWRRYRPCDSCGCGDSCGGGGSCGCHESCGCAKSSGCEKSCGCESCGCEKPCGCESCGRRASCGCESCGCHESCGCDDGGCRPCGLFPCLFPWIRSERCKGGGERYGECGQCGCGELYLGDWRSQPPRCEPCNCCGGWVGPGEPIPSYQMPPRAGSGYGYGQIVPGPNGSAPTTPNDSMPNAAPPLAPPTTPPPTTLPPSYPPRTSQRPHWSNY